VVIRTEKSLYITPQLREKTMILILSQNLDLSTSHVIDWIESFGEKVCRVNETDFFDSICFISNNSGFKINLRGKYKEINSDEIKAFWYRRGQIKIKHPKGLLDVEDSNLTNWYKTEVQYVKNTIYDSLKHIHHVGCISNNRINKNGVLIKARKNGLSIPETIITNRKKDFLNFKQNSKKDVITKGIKENFTELKDGTHSNHYTQIIKKEDIQSMPETFGYSLFQFYEEKKFELRIFYLGGRFYSMAIFSQSNEQTKVDFRRYDKAKPNRTVPFSLPKKIEERLNSLMIELNLKSGSIDMIVNKENEYIFLEVNPVGQFGQVSRPCNYYLEREIAKYLCDYEK
jgi:ATP-GRASP peptide maturase of grasp-with-spasm system